VQDQDGGRPFETPGGYRDVFLFLGGQIAFDQLVDLIKVTRALTGWSHQSRAVTGDHLVRLADDRYG